MQKNAGTKEAAQANSERSFILRDRCKKLTLGEYIELVCEDNLSVLVVDGEPDEDALNAAKMAVLAEFSELSGAGESEAGSLYEKIVSLRAQITAISSTIDVLRNDYDGSLYERACEVLKACGISTRTWRCETLDDDLKRAASILKSKEVRLKAELERFGKMAAKQDGKQTTEVDIRTEISALSSHLGFGILDGCNLATYAAHRKSYAAHAKAMERVQTKNTK